MNVAWACGSTAWTNGSTTSAARVRVRQRGERVLGGQRHSERGLDGWRHGERGWRGLDEQRRGERISANSDAASTACAAYMDGADGGVLNTASVDGIKRRA